jgi:hypothetical protein
VSCNKTIDKGQVRWGIKYGGNLLAQPVLPLYGTHPMVMWCHAGGCGLAFVRLSSEMPQAARTCHACSDVPDESGVRLLCGGDQQNNKVRQHAFHISCWRRAILESNITDTEKNKCLNIEVETIGIKRRLGLSFADLTDSEKAIVRQEFNIES